MIYLAVPYSHPDPEIREMRFRQANMAAGKLMAKGYRIFSPISHSHPIAIDHGLPTDYRWWREFDSEFLRMCDEVFVVKFDGWRESVGIREELKLARELGKPVTYLEINELLEVMTS